jgi:hypothetical protein
MYTADTPFQLVEQYILDGTLADHDSSALARSVFTFLKNDETVLSLMYTDPLSLSQFKLGPRVKLERLQTIYRDFQAQVH